jgi:hypothetical protein
LAAASGLVRAGDDLIVASDDENALGIFPASGQAKGQWLTVFEGVLPAGVEQRKAAKKDVECLALLPASGSYPHGAVLGLGSGSKPNRNCGVIIALDDAGKPSGPPRRLDLSPLYKAMGAQLEELNIEGAVVMGRTLRLLQRGNGQAAQNAWVDVDIDAVTKAASRRETVPASALKSVIPVELGLLEGVRLGLTDASLLPDGRMVFSAAAEDSGSTYADGAVTGSVLGVADATGKVCATYPLQGRWKIEGVHVEHVTHGKAHVLMVADADDPAIAAPLLSAVLPLA